MLTIPGWALWMMLVSSAVGTVLLWMQIKSTGWKL
jgi:hypothetical protein